jgi:hypothetical protein
MTASHDLGYRKGRLLDPFRRKAILRILMMSRPLESMAVALGAGG